MPTAGGGREDRALLGYVRAHLLMTATELVSIKDLLIDFATTEGYSLGKVYTEFADTAPRAFRALLEAVQRGEAAAVVVPGIHHFAVLGSPPAVQRHLEQTGAQVLVARQP